MMTTLAAPLVGLLFAVPTAAPAPVARVPIQLNGNTMFLNVRVNGAGPFDFILDTGALASSITPEVVTALELPTQEGGIAQGAGGRVASRRVEAITLEVGGVKLPSLDLGSFSLTSIANSAGRRVDGVLGAEVFQRYVVEIDYLAQRMTLYDPKTFSARGRGTGMPLRFYDNHPYVEAEVTLGGRKASGEFVIDSGSSFPLILISSFVEEHDLEAKMPPTLTTYARGVGGEVPFPVGRADALRLGGATIARPVTGFPPGGLFARSGTAGNIGGAILRRFRVTFDYSRSRMYLEPNETFGDPYEFDMSGVSFVTESPGFDVVRVLRVIPGSPAEAAGLAAGDEILAVDGRPVSKLRLAELREELRRPGRRVAIEARRGEVTRSLVLTTRRLI